MVSQRARVSMSFFISLFPSAVFYTVFSKCSVTGACGNECFIFMKLRPISFLSVVTGLGESWNVETNRQRLDYRKL